MTGGSHEKIFGRHPVHETLIAKRRRIIRIFIAEGASQQGVLSQILQEVKTANIPVDFVKRDWLDQVHENHQGIVAEVESYPYVSFEDILDKLPASDKAGLVLLLDVIQDPQNLGTLLRTAEAVGVDGVVLPHQRGVGVTPAVVRSSAGASEHLWITQSNLARAIKVLKKEDLWIVGLDMHPGAQRLSQLDFSGSLGLVVGGEGQGLRRLVRESCDFLVRLPMKGRIASLNAAVAGSIALFTIRQTQAYFDDEADGGDKSNSPQG